MFELITLVILAGLLVYREWVHYRLVQDLSSKIKAKDLADYIENKHMEKRLNEPEVPEQPFVPLDELPPDVAQEALEKELMEDDE